MTVPGTANKLFAGVVEWSGVGALWLGAIGREAWLREALEVSTNRRGAVEVGVVRCVESRESGSIRDRVSSGLPPGQSRRRGRPRGLVLVSRAWGVEGW